MVAVVGVIFVLISVTILVSCVLCWFVRPSKLHITYSYYISILLYFTQSYHRRRKRRRNGVYYVNLRANLEDSLQYGSIELQKSCEYLYFSLHLQGFSHFCVILYSWYIFIWCKYKAVVHVYCLQLFLALGV